MCNTKLKTSYMFGEKLVDKNKVGQTLRKHVFNKTFGIRHGNRIKSLNGEPF